MFPLVLLMLLVGVAVTVTTQAAYGVPVGSKLMAGGETPSSAFGFRTALSADGLTMAVGGMVLGQGATAYIYRRGTIGQTWTRQAKIVGSRDNIGFGLALNGNGSTLLFGVPAQNMSNAGVRVYVRMGSIWTLQQFLKPSDGPGMPPRNSGHSVALSSDGNTALVGASLTAGANGAGFVYVRNGNGIWTLQGKLAGTSASAGAAQGSAVALSADGNVAAVAGVNDTPYGAVWMFIRINGVWIQQGNKLVGTNSQTAIQQGHSVALSGNGDMLAVGAPLDASGNGTVWVYRRVAGQDWYQQTKLGFIAEGLTSGLMGYSMAMSNDGNAIFAGAVRDRGTRGSLQIFHRDQFNTWRSTEKLFGKLGTTAANQGHSVAVSGGDSSTQTLALVLGGAYDSDGKGAVWTFKYLPPTRSPTKKPTTLSPTRFPTSYPTRYPTSFDLIG